MAPLTTWYESYRLWLQHFEALSDKQVGWIYTASIVVETIILALLAYGLAHWIVSHIRNRIHAKKQGLTVLTALTRNKVFRIVSYYAPLLVLRYNLAILFPEDGVSVFFKIYDISHVLLFFYLLNALLKTFIALYQYREENKSKPIKGFIQFAQILIFFIGTLLVISILANIPVKNMLAGLGAASAVLMLIFKDSITGLVAGVQISFNQMIKIGDWIEMPKYGVDGDVIDITLTSIKVQNWDKTISSVPTYSVVASDSVKNWAGMTQFGARRIARSVNIDMQSVHICTPEMLERYKKIGLVAPYIDKTQQDIEAYNQAHQLASGPDVPLNGRQQTNLGIFRAYVYAYIKQKEDINSTVTLLVRQLQPGPTGIPLQVYCFTKTTEWAKYENVQSDIFDHILAVIPYFDLKVFQSPSGKDFDKYLSAARLEN
jgi:Small-conductance mechanosensitive channel